MEKRSEKNLGYQGELFTVDAREISMATIGRYFPNTPMLSALVKVANIMDEDDFVTEMEKLFKKKFASKPEVIDGNVAAVKKALKEVNAHG